jgi:hypothetical protein
VTHRYSDGVVNKDSLSTFEMDINSKQIAAGGAFSNTNWISARSAEVGGQSTVTVYNAISTALTYTDSSGTLQPLKNSDGTYLAKTTTSTVTNPDGSTSSYDTNVPTWASTSKFLAYNVGQTRSWQAANPPQVRSDGTVAMHAYGVVSGGGSVMADSSGSTGFDMAMEQRLGRRGRFEWGVSGGFQLLTLNANAQAITPAALISTTDIYKMVDTGYNTAMLNNTKAGIYKDNNGNVVGVDSTQPGGQNTKPLTYTTYDPAGGPGATVFKYVSSTETPLNYADNADYSKATPLDVSSVQWGTAEQIGTVNVHGNYRLKGAYYLMHLGPSFRYQFHERWAVSGTAGLALAYIGTTFTAEEWFNSYDDVYIPGQITDTPETAREYRVKDANVTNKFVPGLYYDFNAEYWVSERTGFFIGVTGQSMRTFKQDPLSERTATIDMGTSSGWRLGIMTRF